MTIDKKRKVGVLQNLVLLLTTSHRADILRNKAVRLGATLTDDPLNKRLDLILAEQFSTVKKLSVSKIPDTVKVLSYDWLVQTTDSVVPEYDQFVLSPSKDKPKPKQMTMDMFASKTKKSAYKYEWKMHGDTVIVVQPTVAMKSSSKVAAFDFDGTLAVTKSGKAFAQSGHDWKLIYSRSIMEAKLKGLHDDGYKIVIFSNQKGVSTGKQTAEEFYTRVSSFCESFDFPIITFAATHGDVLRKPSPCMWAVQEDSYNEGVKVDRSQSFYVGDAAGRQAGWAPKRKKDFSCSDRKFALNSGVQFYTPEEYFLDEPTADFVLGGFDPSSISLHSDSSTNIIPSTVVEAVILVGYPGSGKTTLFETNLKDHGYIHVNQDTLKTVAKCKKTCKDALEAGSSVVIDGTNSSSQKRQDWVSFALQCGAKQVRCVHVDIERGLAEHLNVLREKKGGRAHVPAVAFHTYAKYFTPPTTDEGFSEVVTVGFNPNFNEEEIALFLELN